MTDSFPSDLEPDRVVIRWRSRNFYWVAGLLAVFLAVSLYQAVSRRTHVVLHCDRRAGECQVAQSRAFEDSHTLIVPLADLQGITFFCDSPHGNENCGLEFETKQGTLRTLPFGDRSKDVIHPTLSIEEFLRSPERPTLVLEIEPSSDYVIVIFRFLAVLAGVAFLFPAVVVEVSKVGNVVGIQWRAFGPLWPRRRKLEFTNVLRVELRGPTTDGGISHRAFLLLKEGKEVRLSRTYFQGGGSERLASALQTALGTGPVTDAALSQPAENPSFTTPDSISFSWRSPSVYPFLVFVLLFLWKFYTPFLRFPWQIAEFALLPGLVIFAHPLLVISISSSQDVVRLEWRHWGSLWIRRRLVKLSSIQSVVMQSLSFIGGRRSSRLAFSLKDGQIVPLMLTYTDSWGQGALLTKLQAALKVH